MSDCRIKNHAQENVNLALDQAGKLYERYVELAQLGASVQEEVVQTQAYSWDHPLTLVISDETTR